MTVSRRALATGLVLSLCALALPATAGARLPVAVDVYGSFDSDVPVTVRTADLPQVTRDYDLVLRGSRKASRVSLTGIPLADLLTTGGANLENVNFLKVRYGAYNDAFISLLQLPDGIVERPPLLLSSGVRPGVGPFPTPAIVPGQPAGVPLHEADIVSFSTGKGWPRISLTPGKPGAKILAVQLRSKKTKKGQYKLVPVVLNGTAGAARMYHWFSYDMSGSVLDLGFHGRYTTRDATRGTAKHFVSVVVTERATGSTGAVSFTYTSKKRRK